VWRDVRFAAGESSTVSTQGHTRAYGAFAWLNGIIVRSGSSNGAFGNGLQRSNSVREQALTDLKGFAQLSPMAITPTRHRSAIASGSCSCNFRLLHSCRFQIWPLRDFIHLSASHNHNNTAGEQVYSPLATQSVPEFIIAPQYRAYVTCLEITMSSAVLERTMCCGCLVIVWRTQLYVYCTCRTHGEGIEQSTIGNILEDDDEDDEPDARNNWYDLIRLCGNRLKPAMNLENMATHPAAPVLSYAAIQ
jgi:hypothetical protein